MDKFINTLERKFGRLAIPRLTVYIVGLFIIGYVIQIISGLAQISILPYLTLNPFLILHGQVWRLVSWLLIPPTDFSILIVITIFFYYFIGMNMEATMGVFRYNLFIFTGVIFMIISAFLAYGVYYLIDPANAPLYITVSSGAFSTYYLQQMIFLAFAICYPEMQILFMFFIPLKVKWLGIAYGLILVFEGVQALFSQGYGVFFAIGSQLLNLFLFYLSTGRLRRFRPKEVYRRQSFQKNVAMRPKGVTRHKCATCGRTEETNPELGFRFCSKCNGNYEYCQDHIFTHTHVQ